MWQLLCNCLVISVPTCLAADSVSGTYMYMYDDGRSAEFLPPICHLG